ncbi:MAG: diguanylate cyclase [Leptospiraceae bacterium]|nr:diguanylate cyclase [Leptospiraceae bacterium]MCP5512192.1 diguanylate cyclase [Leptospiraceae bacterium]
MNDILEYEIKNLVYESSNSLIYRAIHKQTRKPFVLKRLREDYPSPGQIKKLENEFKIAKSLNHPNIIQVQSLEKWNHTYVLVMEDIGAESFTDLIPQKNLSIDSFLKLSISIVESLIHLHSKNIIHKDVNPSNIIWNPDTNQIKLIDFGLSSYIQQNLDSTSMDHLEGTLAYISPEQTGRISRGLDHRTDLYSLGATFYFLLTGVQPFVCNDSLEYVHSHLALTPLSPNEINNAIPTTLSGILMKLMEKDADRRYKSALGLKKDLERSLGEWEACSSISEFPPGLEDVSHIFRLPDKLYGREEDLLDLENCLHSVLEGNKEFVLIHGISGIGKSALIREFKRKSSISHPYFISGKFDQFKRNIPYDSILQAFRELIQQILSETDERISKWKSLLDLALGENAQLIIDVIPELELIIGKKNEVDTLGFIEAQNRFNLVFINFIKVLSSEENPLVIFLDDLQWADLSSLNILQMLFSGQSNLSILILGTYRDNEVSPSHPLQITLDDIRNSGFIIRSIKLKSLDPDQINTLISDSLQISSDKTTSLSELCFQKTHGNPFFVVQLIKTLIDTNFIYFSQSEMDWKWEIEKIQSIGITKNVVDLMISKFNDLPLATQKYLKIASCIGNSFEPLVISFVEEVQQSDIIENLKIAGMEGMISLDRGYKFQHDRIQQTAYSLIDESERENIHFKIGQTYIRHNQIFSGDTFLFDIVFHLNKGKAYFKNSEELLELAGLNLSAARKAKDSAAYLSAYEFCKSGISILGNNHWNSHYELCLSLFTIACESSFLSGHFREMDFYSDTILSRATSILDTVNVYDFKMQAFESTHRLPQTIETGIQILKKLDIHFPKKPKPYHTIASILYTLFLLRKYSTDDILNFPEIKSRKAGKAMKILLRMVQASFRSDPKLFPLILLKMVRSTVQYGNVHGSSFAYVGLGLILCRIGKYDKGYEYGKLAIKLLNSMNDKKYFASTYLGFNAFIRYWKEPLSATIEDLRSGYVRGLEVGDYEYGCLCLALEVIHRFFNSENLDDLKLKFQASLSTLNNLKELTVLRTVSMLSELVDLLNRSDENSGIEGSIFDESIHPFHEEDSDRTYKFVHYSYPSFYFLILSDYKKALSYSQEAGKYYESARGFIRGPLFIFHDTLLKLCVYNSASEKEKKELLRSIHSQMKMMESYSQVCPENFLNKFYLLKAEYNRIQKKYDHAWADYENAIRCSFENNYLNEEAISREFFGRFYLETGNTELAEIYLHKSYECYKQWGAEAKLRQMEKTYPGYFKRSNRNESTSISISNSISITKSINDLDLQTILKSTQAISGEMNFENLLKKIMTILIENAGAQKGILLVKESEWMVEIESDIIEKRFEINHKKQLNSVDSSKILPVSIVQYVIRSGKHLLLENASFDQRFQNDTYVLKNSIKSIICEPIIHKGEITAVIYLENNSASYTFQENRLELLNILSAQISISLENSKLYMNMEEKVYYRTKELEKKNHELKELMDAYKDLASKDYLTGVYNRRSFIEIGNDLIEQSKIKNFQTGILMMDIDFFKKINDKFGHNGGDRVLIDFTSRLQEILPENSILARIGGEEFCILISETDTDEVLMFTESIHASLIQSQVLQEEDPNFKYTVSIGCILSNPDRESLDQLIQKADASLYLAKESGRNCTRFYNHFEQKFIN